MFEIARREFIRQQQIGGRIVRRARQSLGERHDGEALARRQFEFVQKILDPADARRAGADRGEQTRRQRRFSGARIVARRRREPGPREVLVGRRVSRRESFGVVHPAAA